MSDRDGGSGNGIFPIASNQTRVLSRGFPGAGLWSKKGTNPMTRSSFPMIPVPDGREIGVYLLVVCSYFNIALSEASSLVLCQDKDLRIIRGYFESDQGASNEYSRGSMIEEQR